MFDTIKAMLGLGPKTDYTQLVKDGAVILDVRTKGEYGQGHIKGSVNVPLSVLPGYYSKLNKDAPIITCCASGMRSAQAKSMLQAKGFVNVHNGGGWHSLKSKLK